MSKAYAFDTLRHEIRTSPSSGFLFRLEKSPVSSWLVPCRTRGRLRLLRLPLLRLPSFGMHIQRRNQVRAAGFVHYICIMVYACLQGFIHPSWCEVDFVRVETTSKAMGGHKSLPKYDVQGSLINDKSCPYQVLHNTGPPSQAHFDNRCPLPLAAQLQSWTPLVHEAC